MSLIVEVSQKIRQLLDKPTSPTTKAQISSLIDKRIVPSSDLLALFSSKHRGDLLQCLIKSQPVPIDGLEHLLTSIISQLLEYRFEEAEALWVQVLGKEEMRAVREQWTSRLLKECLRISNEGLRASQIRLLISNYEFLWSIKEGSALQRFSSNFISAFLKYNIYLPGYSRLLTSILAKEDSFSTVTEETQQRLVERLIDFLRANDKKQSFVFQNECLEACQRILVYKNRPIKDSTVLYNCEKMLEEYLWKKPTRECAFACKESLITAKKSLEQQNNNKMMRNYGPTKAFEQSPLLIENIIEKTNQYQRNQMLQISQPTQNPRPRSTFLQKGRGNGGGRSMILSPAKNTPKQQKGLQELIQSCLSKPAQSVYPLPLDPFPQPQASMMASTVSIQDDENFTEISNLIDLAFRYKFDGSHL